MLTSTAFGINSPTNAVTRSGDLSVVVHWDKVIDPTLGGYRVYRATNPAGPFTALFTTNLLSPGYVDFAVANGQTYYYYATAMSNIAQESAPSPTVSGSPHAFATDNDFLEFVEHVHFDYFWYLANPNNGLVPDRSAVGSVCSIAAVGFGLTAIGIGIDHGWISREQGAARARTTLSTFANGPQGSATTGIIGYKGWFYHFLNMNTALRSGSELSSIDTTLLLGGVLYAKQYFDGTNSDEVAIRSMADTIYNRIDWNWMAQGTDAVSMGWNPGGSGFIANNWIGYDEGMLIYILGLGATNPLPATAWNRWTSGYRWNTYYGQTYVIFEPLFGHQYSHCWVDFRHVADDYMRGHNTTYFENSRRATIAQRAYCIANPLGRVGYSTNIWGLTACDGPGFSPYLGYSARGAPGPNSVDDGTIAPTAAGGSVAFAPEYSVPMLRNIYNRYKRNIWTAYGFKDAFNFGAQWYGPDELGIDQGPIVIMIENYRTQRVWKQFMKNPEVQKGLQRAGFSQVSFVPQSLQLAPDQLSFLVSWEAVAGSTYQVEYSSDLDLWYASPTGEILATDSPSTWTDSGPPGTASSPLSVSQRFYRVFQFGN